VIRPAPQSATTIIIIIITVIITGTVNINLQQQDVLDIYQSIVVNTMR